jgi:hypothetical protein
MLLHSKKGACYFIFFGGLGVILHRADMVVNFWLFLYNID